MADLFWGALRHGPFGAPGESHRIFLPIKRFGWGKSENRFWGQFFDYYQSHDVEVFFLVSL